MIILREPIDAYHLNPALSKTKLSDFARYGAADFKARWIDRTLTREDSPSLSIGRLFDGLCDDFTHAMQGIVARPAEIDMRTKAGKEWALEQSGKTIVSLEDLRMLLEMWDALNANHLARDLWNFTQKQVTIRRELPELGISLQSRPDGLKPGQVIDIKTTRDMNGFDRDCLTYNYHMQLAIGQWLLAKEGEQCEAFLIVVEAKRAPRCRVKRIPEIALAAGWEKAKRLADEIARRIKANDWTETQTEAEDIIIPEWQARKLEESA